MMIDTVVLQAGKRYRLRNGMITGVMLEDPHLAEINEPDRFYTTELLDDFLPMWRSNGRSTFCTKMGDEDTRYYVIEEYTE